MATRTKTVEYVFPTDTASVAAATRRDFAQKTLFIPETASRTFKSVIAEVFIRDNATSASVTSWLIGIKLGAVAFDDVTITSTLTNSGEQQSLIFQRDVTAYFNANFGAGASQTCQVGIQIGGQVTINCYAKLYITYEYDDASQDTRVKTVRIPIDGHTATLTNTLQQIGAADEIPDLDALLPEASKVYRQIWFEIMANESSGSTTDFQMGVRLDAESEVLDGNHEQGANSSTWYKRIWERNDIDTSVAHSFSARATVTDRFDNLAVLLCVTYEYSHADSTSLMNSIILPVLNERGRIGGSVEADLSRGQAKLFIEEPGTIALVRSGYLLNYLGTNNIINASVLTRAGAQTFRTYNHDRGSVAAGQYGIMKRIDADGVNGAGASLARGLNTVTIDVYHTSSGIPNILHALSAVLWLNYTSGKHADGDGVHNHTTFWNILAHAAVPGPLAVAQFEAAAVAPAINEANHYVNVVGYLLNTNLDVIGGGCLSLIAELLSGEDMGDGWAGIANRFLGSGSTTTPSERSLYTDWVPATKLFDRFPADPDASRMAIESARKYRWGFTLGAAPNVGILMLLTYHAIEFAIAGTVSGFSGDGSGITVDAHRGDTGEKIGSAVTAIGGGYTIPWYDDTINAFAHARQSATLMGRSDDGAAV